MIFGKSLEALQKIGVLLKERTLDKYYHCIVKGMIQNSETLEGYLIKDELTNTVKVLSEDEAMAHACSSSNSSNILTDSVIKASKILTQYVPLKNNRIVHTVKNKTNYRKDSPNQSTFVFDRASDPGVIQNMEMQH